MTKQFKQSQRVLKRDFYAEAERKKTCERRAIGARDAGLATSVPRTDGKVL